MREFPSRWAAIAVVLCLADLLISAMVVDAPLRLMTAPLAMRWALVAQECVLLMILAALPAFPERRWIRILVSAWLAATLVTGWFAFAVVGRFPGLDAVRFFFTVPTQAVQHLLQLDASLIPKTLLAIVTLVAVIEGVVALVRWHRARVVRGVVVVLAALLLVGTTFYVVRTRRHYATSNREVYDATTGVTYRTNRLWRSLREGSAGAASGLLLSIWATAHDPRIVIPADPNIRVDSPPRAAGQLVTRGTPSHRWNVLIIEVESMRADVLQAWGGPLLVMPTVEAIAAESRRYRDTYTTATQTDLASVVPLSGQYPLRDITLRAYPGRIPYPKVMIYDLLKPAGWRSAVFSSQNEEWWGMANFLRSPALDTLFHAETFAGSTYTPTNDIGFARFVRDAKRSGKIDDYDTVTEAMKWLALQRTQPFFLYVNLQTSHLPYEAPPRARRRFGAGTPGFPILFGRYPKDSAEVVHNEYRNALAYVDDQIARLQQSLRRDGRWDSTIVIITGDHGQAFFEHTVAGHANGVEQELVQVPLMVRAPGFHTGDDYQPASHVDVAPTVAALLGLPAQPAWQGESLTGDSIPADRPRFFMVQSPLAHRIGVVVGSWKLVRDVRDGGVKLRNLKDDPQTQVDRSETDTMVVRRLESLLDTWRAVQLGYYASTVLPATHFPPRLMHAPLPLP